MTKTIMDSATKPSRCNKQNSSSIRTTWRPVLVLYTVFGYNLLGRWGPARVLLLVYRCLVATSLSTYLVYCSYNEPWFTSCFFVVFEYLSGVLITNLNVPTGKIKNLFPSNKTVDAKLNFGTKDYGKIKSLYVLFLAFLFIWRLMFMLSSYYIEYNDDYLMIIVFGCVVFGVELIQLPRLIFFLTHYYKMKMLRNKIKVLLHSKYVANKGENHNKCPQTISAFESCFRDLVDDIESTSVQIKPMLMLSLCCCFPKIMSVVYISLWSHRIAALPTWYLLVILYEVSLWAILPCLTGVFVEMIKSEIDNIKYLLANELIDPTNSGDRAEVDEFLRYLELRPFSYSVWRLLPVDLSLPVALLSLCITYLIVLIQFSHLYQ